MRTAPRPLPIGVVFRETFAAVRANWLPFLVLATLTSAPGLLWARQVGIEALRGGLPDLSRLLLFSLLGWLLNVVGFGLICFGAVRFAEGRDATLRDYAELARSRLPHLLGVGILVGLIVFTGTVLCIVPGLVAYVILYVALPAVLVERLGIGEALQRSWDLTEGRRASVAGLVLLIFALDLVLQLPINALLFVSGPTWLYTAVLAAKTIAVLPVKASAAGLAYHELRGVPDTDRIAEVFA